MKAVLLAAGRGSRLGETDLPKPLWEIGPRSLSDPTPVAIVERQIDVLRSMDIAEIAVVVGWRQDQVRARLADTGVTFIENTSPDISRSGTAHSFQFAAWSSFAPLEGSSPCLLLDADLVYEREVLATIVRADHASRLLVAPVTVGDEEEVRVYGDDVRARYIGKSLGPPLIDGLTLYGEATGIIRFEPADHGLVRVMLDGLVGRPDGRTGVRGPIAEHEELSQLLLDVKLLGSIAFEDGLLFSEADFREDFERVRRDLYPRILEKERS